MEIAYSYKDWQFSFYNKENDDNTAKNYFFTLDEKT